MKYSLIDGSEGERRILIDTRRPPNNNSEQSLNDKRKNELVFLFQIAMVLFLAGIGLWSNVLSGVRSNQEEVVRVVADELPEGIHHCEAPPCFAPAKIRVSSDRSSFPSFWNYAHKGSLNVSYDSRSIQLNGERVFFLGGSLHPSRATFKTWNYALDEAVRNGLNMITIYVMWSAHQPAPKKDIDWGFPGSYSVECDPGESPTNSCGWNLAEAIRSAADRGLFVHLRVGPYDCAEYNYGGIPEWLPLHKPKMEMRRPNREWLEVMEGFVAKMVAYISKNKLWAHQGGNIVMAQIENELGEDAAEATTENLLLVDESGRFVDPEASQKPPGKLRKATLQDYADWCGALAARLEPKVTWTMCNGLYANNTILTCNAVSDGHSWLEKKGGNGRIQVDQPAIFTEFEGGFQVWGGEVDPPLDYFWGRTARAMSRDAMKWFARGGTHLNYYMWWGGYNRGRSAGAGITNMYASDVAMCPSGQRRQPKFGHFEALHEAIAAVAPTLLAAKTALGRSKPIKYLTKDGNWETGKDQRIFEYNVEKKGFNHVIFVENDADEAVVVQVPIDASAGEPKIISMSPTSSILLVDGMAEFDSASIDPTSMSFQRKFGDEDRLPTLLDWASWQEPIGAASGDPITWTKEAPVEQTELNVDSGVDSDYVWYETSFFVDDSVNESMIFIETQKANAFVVFVDDEFVGAADNHFHKEGSITLAVDIGAITQGEHKLSLLSESLGYNNLIGRWGGSTRQKLKGITSDVLLSLGANSANISLVDGREWRSFPGLHGESFNRASMKRAHLESNLGPGASSSPTWSSALFDTPRIDHTFQGLFLKISSGRGHLWLNGRDLGRYWNITRGETEVYSQEHYYFPDDYLHTDGRLNELIIFDAFGESRSSTELVLSWIAPSDKPNFKDEVDYPLACI